MKASAPSWRCPRPSPQAMVRYLLYHQLGGVPFHESFFRLSIVQTLRDLPSAFGLTKTFLSPRLGNDSKKKDSSWWVPCGFNGTDPYGVLQPLLLRLFERQLVAIRSPMNCQEVCYMHKGLSVFGFFIGTSKNTKNTKIKVRIENWLPHREFGIGN